MLNPIKFVDSFVSDLNVYSDLPAPARFAIRIVKVRHWVWWLNRKRKLYTNPDNWLALGAGFILNITVSSTIVRTAAKVLHIVTRILDCMEQFYKFHKECLGFGSSLRGRYQINVSVKWSTSGGLLTASFRNALGIQLHKSYRYLKHVAKSTGTLLSRIDKIAMYSIDAYQSFFADSEALQRCVTNVVECYRKFDKNRYNLYNLKKKVLEKMGFKESSAQKQLIEETEKFVTNTKKGLEVGYFIGKITKPFRTLFEKRLPEKIPLKERYFSLNSDYKPSDVTFKSYVKPMDTFTVRAK